jgi:hypothetical protein
MYIEIITIVIAVFITLYLLGRYILNPQSLSAKSITVGFDYFAVILVLILIADILVINVKMDSIIIESISIISLVVLILFSATKMRTFIITRKKISTILWIICVIGISLFPVFTIIENQYRIGDMRRIWYLNGLTIPSVIIGLLGFYITLKYYILVIYQRDIE